MLEYLKELRCPLDTSPDDFKCTLGAVYVEPLRGVYGAIVTTPNITTRIELRGLLLNRLLMLLMEGCH